MADTQKQNPDNGWVIDFLQGVQNDAENVGPDDTQTNIAQMGNLLAKVMNMLAVAEEYLLGTSRSFRCAEEIILQAEDIANSRIDLVYRDPVKQWIYETVARSWLKLGKNIFVECAQNRNSRLYFQACACRRAAEEWLEKISLLSDVEQKSVQEVMNLIEAFKNRLLEK